MLIFQLVFELSAFSPQNTIVKTINVHISSLIINDVCAHQRKAYISVFYKFSKQQRISFPPSHFIYSIKPKYSSKILYVYLEDFEIASPRLNLLLHKH